MKPCCERAALHALAKSDKMAKTKMKKTKLKKMMMKKKKGDDLSPVRTREGRKAAGLSPPRDEWQADRLLQAAAKPASGREEKKLKKLKKRPKLNEFLMRLGKENFNVEKIEEKSLATCLPTLT